ncbi:MAG: aspartate aminotransferase family protein [Acidobacteria bacterium]|nr:aspartate aminotransferase family protein [Acidobacteriota bacterium]MBF85919.1 aspartate aminotransferase family protein [Acidobacteriota bacterium]MCH2278398.1 aspartate aminotransferase family protein [Vicinamibacterales bacterium]|tara:strand:- start:4432 stop:5739 length:1308 start_codon:yes stop_codon:yes gene_type:complete
MNRAEIVAKHREFLFPSVATFYADPLPLARGEAQFVWDVDGNRYLDFFAGIVTVGVGHCHPKVTARINEQVRTLQHTSTFFPHEATVLLAEKMAEITPGSLSKTYFTNSGSEANETAVLLARLHTGRTEIIALRHGYSGRSQTAMSLTAHANWRLSPVTDSSVVHAHNAYCYRCAFEKTYPECKLLCARDVEELIKTATSGKIAAFIAEPIQGVGGFVTPPAEYFQEIASIVRANGGLIISDEVQTGFGRTGDHWFGIEHWNLEPDIITCAKAMANGTPVGATVTTAEISAAIKGAQISTFGGNPVTATAALATIEVIEEEGLLANAAAMGRELAKGLTKLKTTHAIVGDVRGKGLMQAIELVTDSESKKPAPAAMNGLLEATRERGLLIGKGGLFGNTVRLSPPLNIGQADVDAAIDILDRSLAHVVEAGEVEV